MPKRIIDLSVPLQAGIASDPPGFQPQIDYLDHGAGARQVVATFPGLRLEDLPGQEGWAVELVRMSTHAGTHMDAPYHYRSMNDDGQPMATVDEIPLEWCIGPGVKLDFRHLPDGHVVSPEELDPSFPVLGTRYPRATSCSSTRPPAHATASKITWSEAAASAEPARCT